MEKQDLGETFDISHFHNRGNQGGSEEITVSGWEYEHSNGLFRNFHVQVDDEQLRNFLVDNRPWAVKVHCIARKNWEHSIRVDEANFSCIPFWVKILNQPL